MSPFDKEMAAVILEPNQERSFDVYRTLREEAGPDYWPISTLAEFFGVNVSTLRAQTRSGHIPRPSMRAKRGSLSLQLYTKADALAIQEFYETTGKPMARRLDPDLGLGEQEW